VKMLARQDVRFGISVVPSMAPSSDLQRAGTNIDPNVTGFISPTRQCDPLCDVRDTSSSRIRFSHATLPSDGIKRL
jgi:hypothetical protein